MTGSDNMVNVERLAKSLPLPCHRVYNNLLNLFGDSLSISNIIDYVELQKPVIVDYSSMDVGRTGLVISLTDVYYIVIREDINNKRKTMTLLHELSHILLNHIKTENFLWNDIAKQIPINILYDHINTDTYASPLELEAESLATVLDIKIRQCEYLASLPTIVRDSIKREYQK
ncbi:ImmA/IrrE family metallo-endopeptidase [Herpetosiphon geysericola]|uniref:Uncharacterized protein n=1 Tax=Herpetosiphon geysericola TaxID=70996 RepID=A0A0P6XV60_9CHLR|nr:ImmA/IrrE family metallo-endopeptidase [Herpetosiphon geysericola]KPL83003.1 hypothetical protein SE18_19350 [Herpetosiphon geysericola]